MKHYARYAHLENRPDLEVGNLVFRGDIVGIMGNTGQSTGAHLHFDLVQKYPGHVYRLAQLPDLITDHNELHNQYHYFIDSEMWGAPFKITTSFADPSYIIDGKWKLHMGYDLVPMLGDWGIFWNRSKQGKVVDVGYDIGYGNYIVIEVDL